MQYMQLNHIKKPYENKLFLVYQWDFLAKTEVARTVLLKNCWMTSERVKINMKIIKISDAVLIFITKELC